MEKAMTLVEQALNVLKEQGYKNTKKREALITYLIKNNRYCSAKEIHQFLETKFAGISFDTVYRNLHDFCDIELVEETDLNGEMKFRYHCCQGKIGHHHHFICTVCGKTKELERCPMDSFAEQLPGCTIEGHRFEIYGRCEECAHQ
jgi:Fur family zinc uptake transcriptional regulator